MVAVEIPKELVIESTTAKLLPEVEEWLNEQLLGSFEVKFVAFAFRINVKNKFQIVFDNDRDAIVFKLRWW